MIVETLKPTGKLNIVLRDKDGNIKEEHNVNNLVVDTGLDYIAQRMRDTSQPTEMTHMGLGSGTTAAAAGDTALQTELTTGSTRVAFTSDTVTNNTITYVATFGAGVGTGAVTEAGVFTAITAGTMLCRTVFSVVNKGADDSITITWTITISG